MGFEGPMTDEDVAIWDAIWPADMCIGLEGKPLCTNLHSNRIVCNECFSLLEDYIVGNGMLPDVNTGVVAELLHPVARHRKMWEAFDIKHKLNMPDPPCT